MRDLFGETAEERVLRYIDVAMPVVDRDALLADLEATKKAKPCFKNGRFEKSMAGMGSLWGYFPHVVDVKVNGVSLRDKLSSPDIRATIARKTGDYVEKHEGGKVSFNRIRQSVKAYSGHHVSNFRPVAARDLYRHLNAKSVFDPCAGWGGRMMGAAAAGVEFYGGIDASKQTANSLSNLAIDLDLIDWSIQWSAAEDVHFRDSGFDVAFTSPPYFDTERYSEDSEQSWKRYPTYAAWRDGFLGPLAVLMAREVRPGGFVCLNIADVKKLPLVADAGRFLREAGLVEHDRWHYVLSSIAGKGEKTEPILVYRKPLP